MKNTSSKLAVIIVSEIIIENHIDFELYNENDHIE